MTAFSQRCDALPRLGIGVSTEYGASTHRGALDIGRLVRDYPTYAQFLEVGVSVETGLDDDAQAWVESGRPATYHFLDLNLDDRADFDPAWMARFDRLVAQVQPAWICGDAGLWHFGRRERGHMLLLPPILTRDSARELAQGIIRLREHTGLEVLPENPPGHVFVGDLHLLDFFALVLDEADTGMLLDAAHLAIYQQVMGHDPLTGLDGFPCERIIETHIAGASAFDIGGTRIVEDDHTVDVLDETWTIATDLGERATALRAVVFECERNSIEDCLPGFGRIEAIFGHRFVGQQEAVE